MELLDWCVKGRTIVVTTSSQLTEITLPALPVVNVFSNHLPVPISHLFSRAWLQMSLTHKGKWTCLAFHPNPLWAAGAFLPQPHFRIKSTLLPAICPHTCLSPKLLSLRPLWNLPVPSYQLAPDTAETATSLDLNSAPHSP